MKEIFKAYLILSKIRIVMLVLVTTAIGYFLASHGRVYPAHLVILMLGIGLASAGGSALNQYLEKDYDRLMERTKNRPIPKGVVAPLHALVYGIMLVLSGVLLLFVFINLLTSFLVLLAAFIYCLVYTPMKRHTWLNTYIGSIPGAIPPMAGWTAVTNQMDVGAWALFLILFIWQHPHFYALAWILKKEYGMAGFKMLPVVYPDQKTTFIHIIFSVVVLIPISLMPYFIGLSGPIYLAGALMLGLAFFAISLKLAVVKSDQYARTLFRASIVYLPILFAFIIADQYCHFIG